MNKRDLDIAIQEYVFGDEIEWRLCYHDIHESGAWSEIQYQYERTVNKYPEMEYSFKTPNTKEQPCYTRGNDFWEVVPFYSKDIYEAWKILDHVKYTRDNDEGWFYYIQNSGPDTKRPEGEVIVTLEKYGKVGGTLTYSSQHRDVEVAICLAVLQTEGINLEGFYK